MGWQMSESNAETAEKFDGRRQEIAQIALAVFLNKGYAGASMAQVAREAGIHKSSLYHHFSSKEAMFLAALTSDTATLLETVDRLAAAEGPGADARFLEALGVYFDVMRGSSIGALSTVIAETARQVPEVSVGFHTGFIARFRRTAQVLYGEAVAQGSRRPLREGTIERIIFGPLLADAMEDLMMDGVPAEDVETFATRDKATFIAMIDELTAA